MSETQSDEVTLEQWRALLAVAEAGGLAEAAQQLGVSHSRISYAISTLEAALQLKVLSVDGRHTSLTQHGMLLVPHARDLVQESASIAELAASLRQGWEHEVRVVFDPAFPVAMLLQTLSIFTPLSRGTRVLLREAGRAGAEASLRAGDVELIITAQIPEGHLGESIASVEFVPLAHAGHRLFSRAPAIASGDLRQELCLQVGDCAYPRSLEANAQGGRRWTLSGFDTVVSMLRAGHGYSWLPRDRANAAMVGSELDQVPLSEGATARCELFIVYGQPKRIGPATRHFAELLTSHAANQPH